MKRRDFLKIMASSAGARFSSCVRIQVWPALSERKIPRYESAFSNKKAQAIVFVAQPCRNQTPRLW